MMKKTMEELWKGIPGFPGYEVSNLGRVRSYFGRAGDRWKIADSPQRILRPSQSSRYQAVILRRNNKNYSRRIGRLALLSFVGPPPDGMETCHNDGDSTNDCLTNLRWDTHKANMEDASSHGQMAGKVGRHKALDQDDVYTARRWFAFGKSIRMLAGEFGVSYSTILDVLSGQGAYRGGQGPIRELQTRLTDRQAVAIRRQRASGKSLASLAKRYGVTPSTISRISSGKRHGGVLVPT